MINHEKSIPLRLHNNVMMLVNIYEYKKDNDDYFDNYDFLLSENFAKMIEESTKHLVKQLAPYACALFWQELTKSIREQVEMQDKEFGSNHSAKL